MHRQLRSLLPDAEGISDLVVVIFLDVRGFSSFARLAESSEAALFLRSMYLQILDGYFPDAAFFKPTGDGLMIIRHYDKSTLDEVVCSSIVKSNALVDAFPQICSDDPMINFEVPASIGIGIARGAATGLVSGDSTLDYSGRPLNLAARLTDLARPEGVIFDTSVTKGIDLEGELLKQFVREEAVFVRGIADVSPISLYRSLNVRIPARNRRPLLGKPHEQKLAPVTAKELNELGSHIHQLSKDPIDPDAVQLELRMPDVTGNGRKHATRYRQVLLAPVKASLGPKGWSLVFDYSQAVRTAKAIGVKSTWEVTRSLLYVVPEEVKTAD